MNTGVYSNGIVFLDIDGVLNTPDYIQEHGCDGIDPILVKRLERLISLSKAKIVVSSSWRVVESPFPLEKITKFLADVGTSALVLDAIMDCTPDVREYVPRIDNFIAAERGHEIDLWFEIRHVPRGWGRFVVLDDNLIGPRHAAHLVRTDAEMGLQDKDIDAALGLLHRLAENHQSAEVFALMDRMERPSKGESPLLSTPNGCLCEPVKSAAAAAGESKAADWMCISCQGRDLAGREGLRCGDCQVGLLDGEERRKKLCTMCQIERGLL